MTHLSSAYTRVPPTALGSKDFTAPAIQDHVRPFNLHVAVVATEDEYYAWLGKVKTAADKSIMNGWISWSAYYAEAACVVRVDSIPSPSFNRSMLMSIGIRLESDTGFYQGLIATTKMLFH